MCKFAAKSQLMRGKKQLAISNWFLIAHLLFAKKKNLR